MDIRPRRLKETVRAASAEEVLPRAYGVTRRRQLQTRDGTPCEAATLEFVCLEADIPQGRLPHQPCWHHAVIAVRGADGEVNCFENRCSHRRVDRLRRRRQRRQQFRCVYHSWSYDLSGNLRASPSSAASTASAACQGFCARISAREARTTTWPAWCSHASPERRRSRTISQRVLTA